MLNGDLSFFEGAIKVCSIAAAAGIDPNDPDLQKFVTIQSATDHLPPDRSRHLWNSDALKQVDQELEECEAWASEFAPDACQNLIERLGGDDAQQIAAGDV